MLRRLLAISLIVCVIVLISSCATQAPTVPAIELPTLDAFEPPRIPSAWIDEPTTDVELMHNSIQLEFLLYDWQDYADALKHYINSIKIILTSL